MFEEQKSSQRYMITYMESVKVSDVVKDLQAQRAEIYLNSGSSRKIGARVPIDKLAELIKSSLIESSEPDPL